jgi:uncharacterized membrane protein YhaH (DUF805 family)
MMAINPCCLTERGGFRAMSITYYFTPEGRVRRPAYLGGSLLTAALTLAVAALGVHLIHFDDVNHPMSVVGCLLFVLGGTSFIVSHLSFAIRRLHDIGLSGWHMLWIVGVNLAANAINNSTDSVGMAALLSLMAIAPYLWLTFYEGGYPEYAFTGPSRAARTQTA